jgi:2-polyprenyl-6-methoxyphenol hydroxylase-like FAD-dependent oxidoreductase
VQARYLVGCDGGRSTLRRLADFGFTGTPALLRTIAARVEFDGDIPSTGRYTSGTFLRGAELVGVTEPVTSVEPITAVTTSTLASAIERVTGVAVSMRQLRDARLLTDQARVADTYRRGECCSPVTPRTSTRRAEARDST